MATVKKMVTSVDRNKKTAASKSLTPTSKKAFASGAVGGSATRGVGSNMKKAAPSFGTPAKKSVTASKSRVPSSGVSRGIQKTAAPRPTQRPTKFGSVSKPTKKKMY
jgi:hypothetical protein